MKKNLRIISVLAGIIFVFGITACSNQFDELKKSLKTSIVTNAQDNTDSPAETVEEVTYYVEHWLQATDGRTFGLDSKATQTLLGKKAALTAAVAKEYQGFTAEEITQQIIKGDGSTTVKVYYDRNIITYTFNANGGKWSDNSDQKTITGLYEAIVPVITEPAKDGARFCDWDTIVPQTFGLENQAYEAVWLTDSLTSYKIEHCLQNIYDDDYTINTVQVRTGLPGGITEATPLTYTGFDMKSVTQNTINADGSTIARVYYDRKNITYTFKIDPEYGKFTDNTTSKDITKRYGAKVEPPSSEDISQAFYHFTGWKNIPENYGEIERIFNAEFEIVYDSDIVMLARGAKGSIYPAPYGTYVYFGYWPQTIISPGVHIIGNAGISLFGYINFLPP